VWGELSARHARVGGNAATGVAARHENVFDVEVGRDRRIGVHALGGLALGAASGRFSVDGAAQAGTVDTLHLAGYAAWRRGGLDAGAMLGWGVYANRESRTVSIQPGPLAGVVGAAVPALGEAPTGRTLADAADAEIDAGYHLRILAQRLRVYSGAGLVALHQHALVETGASASALVYPAWRENWRALWTGLTWQRARGCRHEALDLRLQHAWRPPASWSTAFVAAPQVGFMLRGARAPADTLHARLSLHRCLRSGWSWRAALHTVIGRGERGLGLDGGLTLRW
jgi:uncharacterized protein with beta-barrel porin domain